MKKSLLAVALVAIFAMSMTSCGKKTTDNTTKLCNEKGWVLTAATVDPAIQLQSGESVTDFYAKYLYAYEQDDIMVFAKSGSETIKPGKEKAGDNQDGYIEDKASTWSFNDDETVLKCQIPFMYDLSVTPARTFSPDFENCTISKLTETEMVLIFKAPIDFSKSTEYTFTLTYGIAK